MANIKITDLNAFTDPASTDVLAIVDVSADETKKVTIADLLENAGAGSASACAFAFDADKDTGMYRVGANQLGFATAGTGRLFITAGGNVGVGGTPARPFHVNSTGTSVPVRIQGDSTLCFVDFKDTNTTADYKVRVGSAGDDLIGYAGGSEKFRILSSGNVGIGTTSPDSSAQTHIYRSGGNVPLLLQTDQATSYVYFRDSGSGAYSNAVGSESNALLFVANGFQRAKISSTGNVGIGEISPDSLLHLTKSDATAYNALATDGQVGIGPTIYLQNPANSNSTVGGQIVFGMRSTEVQARIGATGGTAPALTFGTADAERMRIDSAGNVGIGAATDANGRLTIFGAAGATAGIQLYETSTGNNARLRIRQEAAQVVYDATSSAGGNAHRFQLGGSDALVIDSSGNVGIGVSNPGSPIDLNYASSTAYVTTTDTSPAITAFNTSSSTNAYAALKLSTYGSGTGASVGTVSLVALPSATTYAADFAIQQRTTSGAFRENLRITHDGNVAVGNTSTNHRFLVYTVGTNDSYLQIANGSTGLAATQGLRIGTPGAGNAEIVTDGSLALKTGNTDSLTITSTGNFDFSGNGNNSGQIYGGFGAATTSGTADWNSAANARPGCGQMLLLGTATNGPGGSTYFHVFTFEYFTKDGTGNLTQTAWGYTNQTLRYMRCRVTGTWTAWSAF